MTILVKTVTVVHVPFVILPEGKVRVVQILDKKKIITLGKKFFPFLRASEHFEINFPNLPVLLGS